MDFVSIVREILDLIAPIEDSIPKEDPIKFIQRPSISWSDYIEEDPFDHIHTMNNRKGE